MAIGGRAHALPFTMSSLRDSSLVVCTNMLSLRDSSFAMFRLSSTISIHLYDRALLVGVGAVLVVGCALKEHENEDDKAAEVRNEDSR